MSVYINVKMMNKNNKNINKFELIAKNIFLDVEKTTNKRTIKLDEKFYK